MASIRDLVFDPTYPYRYIEYQLNGNYKIIFSKQPMLIPSLIERVKIQNAIEELKKQDKTIFEIVKGK